jgi:cytochrome oxidase assembly protein ShyY1
MINENNQNIPIKCLGNKHVTFFATIIIIVILFILGTWFYRNFENVKVELESCRSSLASD